ncbi:MAG: murein L,D-transpeptidase [Pseudomonadales bacterium]
MKQPDPTIKRRWQRACTSLSLVLCSLLSPVAHAVDGVPTLSPTITVQTPLAAQKARAFNPQVLALFDAYQRQLDIVRRGGWPLLGKQPTLKQGMLSAAMPTLRQRLLVSGDLADDDSADPELFDSALSAAVSEFQRRHGLNPDGVVGPGTRRALNVTAAVRLRQLALNIARWDALRTDFDSAFVLVNMPEYALQLFDQGDVALDMRVVIGKRSNPTPQLVQEMRKLVLNPTWFVPKKIGARELLPKVQRDQDYLQQQNLDVFAGRTRIDPATIDWQTLTSGGFDYRFRQRPGPGNSLGKVKFILPNSRSIYLHDTPHKALFAREQRAFSHGCVRLEQPLELARAVLGLQQRWSPERAARQLRSERTVHLQLDEPIPVYLAYLTAKVEDGQIMYFDDVYGHDEQPLQQSVLPSELVATLSELRSFKRARQSALGTQVLAAIAP